MMDKDLEKILQTGCFITATDTGVGKTQITAALASWFGVNRPNHKLQVWKPVQSGARLGESSSDSYRLWRAWGGDRSEAEAVTYSLEAPLAPWVAAKNDHTTIDFAKLLKEGYNRKEQADVLLVEGAGGWLVPLTGQDTIADLAAELQLPVLLIARVGLGTVNHSLLTIESIRAHGCRLAGVVLNHHSTETENMEMKAIIENIEMIERFGKTTVWGVFPWIEANDPQDEQQWSLWREQIAVRWSQVQAWKEN